MSSMRQFPRSAGCTNLGLKSVRVKFRAKPAAKRLTAVPAMHRATGPKPLATEAEDHWSGISDREVAREIESNVSTATTTGEAELI